MDEGKITFSNATIAVPVGTIIWFAGASAPDGYAECDGSALLINDYQQLYAVIGTIYGDDPPPQGYFYLPDLRSEFVRGWDPSVSRAVGDKEDDNTRVPLHSHTHTHTVNHNHTQVEHGHKVHKLANVGPGSEGGTPNAGAPLSGNIVTNMVTPEINYANPTTSQDSTSYESSGEVRPSNIALLPCIRLDYSVTS